MNEEGCNHIRHANHKDVYCGKQVYKKGLCKGHYQEKLIKECCEYMEKKHGVRKLGFSELRRRQL